jgi:dipeptidyl aminopeptidase/acylaminoacyl peptidase
MLKRAFAFTCVLAVVPLVAEAARPVTFDDIMKMRRIETPAISPDGAHILYVVRQWETSSRDPLRKEARTQVWRVTVADGAARQLTFDDAGASAPAWSPDGRVVTFLSARGTSADDRRAQVWQLPVDGGEATQLTNAKEAVSAYTWSPDGKRIAYVSREPEAADEEARRKRGDDRRIFEDEFRLLHIWVVDVGAKSTDRITEGRALSVRGTPSWSADSQRLAFAAAPTTMARDDRSDIYIADLSSKVAEKITSNPGPDSSPHWSPDGRTIAFTTEPNASTPIADGTLPTAIVNTRLMLYDIGTRSLKSLETFDNAVSDLEWTSDSRRLLVTAVKGVHREVFTYEIGSGRFTEVTRRRIATLGGISRDGSRLAVVLESAIAPPDLFVSDLAFSAPRRLTTLNPETSELTLGETEIVRWKSTDGIEIEGVLQKPVGFSPRSRYPLLVAVHGGPAGVFLDSYRVTTGDGGQHWAGQGWAVFYPNPRGSVGYGERFMQANQRDWGGGDFRDIMTGVDALVSRGIADPDRLAILGWSYGGYMTAWAITQTSRFKAAMVGAGLTNLWSMYGSNDIPNTLAAYFNGLPSPANLPLYMERSALTHAAKVTTPTLILHGAADERVPIGQPMEFYRALKDRGVATELVFYPRAGHGLNEYYHLLDRLQRQFAWITTHVGAKRATSP